MYILFIERPFIKMLNRVKNETILNVKRSRALQKHTFTYISLTISFNFSNISQSFLIKFKVGHPPRANWPCRSYSLRTSNFVIVSKRLKTDLVCTLSEAATLCAYEPSQKNTSNIHKNDKLPSLRVSNGTLRTVAR